MSFSFSILKKQDYYLHSFLFKQRTSGRKNYTVETVLFTWETDLTDSHILVTGKEPFKDLSPIKPNCTIFQKKKMFFSSSDLPFVQISVKDGFQCCADRFGTHSAVCMSNTIIWIFFTSAAIIHKTQKHQ